MTYDLRRLRFKGLIHRIPRTHRYTATTYGLKVVGAILILIIGIYQGPFVKMANSVMLTLF